MALRYAPRWPSDRSPAQGSRQVQAAVSISSAKPPQASSYRFLRDKTENWRTLGRRWTPPAGEQSRTRRERRPDLSDEMCSEYPRSHLAREVATFQFESTPSKISRHWNLKVVTRRADFPPRAVGAFPPSIDLRLTALAPSASALRRACRIARAPRVFCRRTTRRARTGVPRHRGRRRAAVQTGGRTRRFLAGYRLG